MAEILPVPYPKFDAKEDSEKIIKWIKDWFDLNGPKANAIIGISGGKDSTIAAGLCVKALGKDRVIGVLMPNGIQPDIDDSLRVIEALDIKYRIVNINSAYSNLIDVITSDNKGADANFELSITDALKQNLPPRLRMATLYAIAQGVENGGRVINTCNKSEDYIGYSTKYGDSAGDLSPLGSYTVQEVLAIGDYLKILPNDLVHKAPSDGLCGLTDEDNLGFSYEMLDKYIMTGKCEDESVRAKIDRLHNINLHKVSPMPMVNR